ncbi:MAG: insulinase family protein [Deltaproteobacteria bacterium]|nr:insulinase family protein [Deltaproteobacteria bacterium]
MKRTKSLRPVSRAPICQQGGGNMADVWSGVREFDLENGLKVLALEDHMVPSVSFQVHFAAGSRNEMPGITGIAHLFEHLMFKRTTNLKPEEFSRIIQANGGELNAFTTQDCTAYFENLPSDRLELAARLEAERISNLLLDMEGIKTEREVVRSERRLRIVNSPDGMAMEQLYATAFDQHPYQWPVIGWDSDLRSISVEECREFYRTYYAPNNAVIVMVGDLDPQRALETVRKYFDTMERQKPPPPVRSRERPQRGEKRAVVRKMARLPLFCAGYHVPNITHPDIYPLLAVATLLAHGRSARFYQKFVKTGKAVEAGADVGQPPFLSADDGLMIINATAAPAVDISRLERDILDETESLARTPVAAEELEKAKKQLRSSYLLSLQTNFFKGLVLGQYQTRAGDWRMAEHINQRYQTILAEDVLRVAQEYLRPSNRTVVTLVPVTEDENTRLGPIE